MEVSQVLRMIDYKTEELDQIFEAFQAHLSPSVCLRMLAIKEIVEIHGQDHLWPILEEEQQLPVLPRLAHGAENAPLVRLKIADNIQLRLRQVFQLVGLL